jgi:hypothetical protein
VIGQRLASFVPHRLHSGRRVNSELTKQTLPE